MEDKFKVEKEISQFGIPLGTWRVIGDGKMWAGFATEKHAIQFAKTNNETMLKKHPT